MKLPAPAYSAYVEFVTTAVVTVTLLQYLGVFGPSGAVDLTFLVGLCLTLPVFTYLLTVVCENTTLVSQWEKMIRGGRQEQLGMLGHVL